MDAHFKRGYVVLVPEIRGHMPVEAHLKNAAVVVGLDYPLYDVLNHDLTRIIASYPNTMFGVSGSFWDDVKTGDIVSVHSNGIASAIYNITPLSVYDSQFVFS